MREELSHLRDQRTSSVLAPDIWRRVARIVLTSRTIDVIEESELLPAGKLRHQFSARGHELVQALVAAALQHPRDAAMGYYRSRPLLLGAGLTPREAFAASFGTSSGRSRGRDVGVMLHLKSRGGATILPSNGDVGGQFTPVAGWAKAIAYRETVLGEAAWHGAIAVAMGGDASVATNGFWSALTLATTLQLPMLFVIEDNGLGISTPSHLQTPGGNIAGNLRSFGGLRVDEGSGIDPEETARLIDEAVRHVRTKRGPALLRLEVPRLCSHSGLDNQATYLPPEQLEALEGQDPLTRLEEYLLQQGLFDQPEWSRFAQEIDRDVRRELADALRDPPASPSTVTRHVFSDAVLHEVPAGDAAAPAAGERVTMKDALRTALEHELAREPRMVVLGEDVAVKGGVHGVTAGLLERFGKSRVVDTSLSEEGIIGRSVGMALAGLRPVAEIQFRKYLDPATEQLNNCGTVRWRTCGEFSAPVVVRLPVGHHSRVSDPWHSVSGEATLAHMLGWKIAFPSNARDAAGLLRTALRGDDPTFFLEHRNLLVSSRSAAPDPGPKFMLPFGEANVLVEGAGITLVTWGDLVYRALDAAARFPDGTVEVIDLRTIVPWDQETVTASVQKTGRCLVLHEDSLTAGFGAEIAATIGREAFLYLEAPIERMAAPDCPIPFHRDLVEAVLPGVDGIAARLQALLEF